jgi:hypothetical protein
MPLSSVINKLFLKGSGPAASAQVQATANSIGAVSVGPGFVSGIFKVTSLTPLNTTFMTVNGEPTYQQLALQLNVSGQNSGGTFIVECTNDPGSAQWDMAQYIYKLADAGSGVNGFLPVTTPGFSPGSFRCSAYLIGIAGFAYVRVRYLIATAAGTLILCNWTAITTAAVPPVINPSISNGAVSADGSGSPVGVFDQSVGNSILGVGSYLSQGASNTWVWQRTPTTFRGSQFNGTGANVIWQPPSTKKVRLMRYQIEVGEDATIVGGPLPINLAFSQQLGTVTAAKLSYPGFGYTHRLVIPAAVLSSSFDGYISDWIDFGNGIITDTAGRALIMGIQIPQTTGAITSPAWTIASNQWEAATVGFKTNGNLGNFKLVQQNNGVAASSAIILSAVQSVTGNSYFVFFRTTNPVGGAPTVTVTDTALNTYTTGTLVTNATDSANGSSLGVAYCINATGTAANVVTVTTATNLSTQIEAIYIEYAGMGSGGIDAAQVGTTGNSTAPASGNYTPSTAGDLVFTFMATAASLASQPTVPTAFVLRGALFNATQGALAVADNFGNGTFTTGQVNLICCGTEE